MHTGEPFRNSERSPQAVDETFNLLTIPAPEKPPYLKAVP